MYIKIYATPGTEYNSSLAGKDTDYYGSTSYGH